jgi:hypothetical protein
MDCRDTDEASVMLAASAACVGGFKVCGLAVGGDGTAPGVFACPVMSSLLNESTSNEPFPPTEGLDIGGTSFNPCSISSNVFLNGFAGGRPKAGRASIGMV